MQQTSISTMCCVVLKIVPGDLDALRCKVTAYIQTSDFEAAMALLSKTSFPAAQVAYDKVSCCPLLVCFAERCIRVNDQLLSQPALCKMMAGIM